ncbi:MAG: hypothetical protein R2939_02750 [Kofleriaceae bacterium]
MTAPRAADDDAPHGRAERPLVVLLHGLARREGSLAGMAAALRRAGFETWSQTYPSRRQTIGDAARSLTEAIVAVAGARPLLAVTHSLGGIVWRHMHDPRLRWRRAVMLAPPNAGSELARALSSRALFRWFYGPAGAELGAAEAWPPPPADALIIAGRRGRALTNPTSWTVARRFGAQVAHDGTVAVDETRLPGLPPPVVVDATHTWIMNDAEVQAMTAAFLGRGDRPPG